MSEIRLRGEWQPLTDQAVAAVGGHMGVYELSSPKGTVVFIGYAGGRSVFGLRGELQERISELNESEVWFRCEITSTYLSRFKEIMMVHVADHGSLPRENNPDDQVLGRLSPS